MSKKISKGFFDYGGNIIPFKSIIFIKKSLGNLTLVFPSHHSVVIPREASDDFLEEYSDYLERESYPLIKRG